MAHFRECIMNQNDIAFRLTKQLLLTEGKDSNLVYSPLSIHVVLSLIAAGSKGPTLDQLLSFFNSKSTDHLNSFASELVPAVFAEGSQRGGVRLSFGNGLWIHKSLPLKPCFKKVVETAYKAALHQVDFQTKAEEVRIEVNSWAEKETRGLIKEVLPPDSVDNKTRLMFANALYFKGAWDQKFDASTTKEYDFHLLNGSSVGAVRVPFMSISKKKQLISAFDGFKVLKLPYQQGHQDNQCFSMYFFLPDAIDGLQDLVGKLGSESGFLDRHVPYKKVEVGEFRIPRFKISFGFEASDVLKVLGLDLPFSAGGGLTEMVDYLAEGQQLYVSTIFQKSFIEVNEEGTEAAAVTSVGCTLFGMPLKTTNFVADHPFLFLIREEASGTVLFIGYVLNPLQVAG